MTQITKLYTEEQLFDICQSVAEKMCANSLPKESVIGYLTILSPNLILLQFEI